MERNGGSFEGKISRIEKQFLVGVLPKLIFSKFEKDWKCKDEQWQLHLLDRILGNPFLKKYPPLISYQRVFFKTLIHKLEVNGIEITEKLYETYAKLVQMPCVSSSDEHCYRIYSLNSDLVVVLKESQSFISHGTTGLVTWQASKALAEWCMLNSGIFNKRKVLELGCGLGLCGITICKSCNVLSYVFSDCNTQVLNLLRHNLEVNLPSAATTGGSLDFGKPAIFRDVYTWNDTRICVMPFHWDDEITMKSVYKEHLPNIILAADVIYDMQIIPYLMKVLKFLLCGDDSEKREQCQVVAYISTTVRNEDTLHVFLKDAGKWFF